jgi:hypothetical protein
VTLQLVNTRASLLGASRVIDDISLDKYTFLRDAYLQRRRSLVFDGDAPESENADDPGPTKGGADHPLLRHRPRQPRRLRPRRRQSCDAPTHPASAPAPMTPGGSGRRAPRAPLAR